MRADLHTHTNASDGTLSRDKLLGIAAAEGLTHIAITDHDTLANSYSAPNDPVQVIRGVELSAFDRATNRRVHILCYLPKEPSPLHALFERMNAERLESGLRMIELVGRVYPIVTPERMEPYLSADRVVYKQRILNLLMEYGYTDAVYGGIYDRLFDPKTGSCFVPNNYPDVWETLQCVKDSRGVAVAAHPSVYDSMDFLKDAVKKGVLDGIEVFHPRNSEKDKKTMLGYCRAHGLLATSGSDYHGANSVGRGFIGECAADRAVLEALFECSDKK